MVPNKLPRGTPSTSPTPSKGFFFEEDEAEEATKKKLRKNRTNFFLSNFSKLPQKSCPGSYPKFQSTSTYITAVVYLNNMFVGLFHRLID